MRRILQQTTRILVRVGASAIILAAVLLLALRLLLPQLDGLRPLLLGQLEQALGVRVQVGQLRVRLNGLSPELAFTDAWLLAPVATDTGSGYGSGSGSGSGNDNDNDNDNDNEDAVGAAARPLLSVRGLRVSLDLLASLLARRPRIEAITLVGADIKLVRNGTGQIRILGLDAMDGDDATALDFFLHQGRFRLIESRLHWRDSGHPETAQSFCIDLAELANAGDTHRLRLQLRPHRDPTGEVQLLGLLEGPADTPAAWSGELYLGWLGADPGALLDGLLPPGLDLSADSVQLESWNQVGEGRLQQSLSRLSVSGLTLARPLALGRPPQQALGQAAAHRHQRLGDLSTLARWQPTANGWRLDLADLRLPAISAGAPGRARAGSGSTAGRSLPGTGAQIRFMRGSGVAPSVQAGTNQPRRPRLFAAIGRLPVGPVVEALTALLPEDATATEVLSGLKLSGVAQNLAFQLALPQSAPASGVEDLAAGAARDNPGSKSATPALADAGTDRRERATIDWETLDWRLRTELEDLSMGSADERRSVRGLDLSADMGPEGGRLTIDASGVEMTLNPLFAGSQGLTQLRGDVAWRRMPAGSIHLWTQALQADTAHLQSLTRLSLCAHPSGASPFIDLHTQLFNADIEAMPNWLPVGIMDPRLVAWLEQAIVAGTLTSGDLLLRGSVDELPFDDQQGRFLLVLRVIDGVLDYGTQAAAPAAEPAMRSAETAIPALGWPPLHAVAASLRFENRSLEIEVADAEILSTQVTGGRARLADLWNPRYIEIEARGAGPLTDGQQVLATTPLAKQLGGLAGAVEVSGDSKLALELGVPLTRGLPFRYQGRLSLSAAGAGPDPSPQLNIKGTDLRFRAIDGQLQFGEDGINAQAISATLGEQALQVDVTTQDSGQPDARTDIGLRGRTAMSQLATTLPPLLTRFIRGRLDWRLILTLSNRDAAQPQPPLDFALRSDLRGIAVSAPAPIGKRSRESRALSIEGRYQPEQPLTLNLTYGGLGARLELNAPTTEEPQLARASIRLDGAPATLPAPGQIEIAGQLPRLDLQPWLDWSAQLAKALADKRNTQAPLTLLPIRLQADELRYGDLRMDDLDATLTPEQGRGWRIDFSTAQSGPGEVRLPPTGRREPVRARLATFDIEPLTQPQPARERGADQTRAEIEGQRKDPRRLEPLRLEIDRLTLADKLLGRFELRTTPRPNGLHLDQISLQGPHLDIQGRGDWRIDATDYVESQFQLTASSDAVGELLRSTGFYSALSEAPGQMTADLTWPGAPGDFSVARARGDLSLAIGAGRMLDMEPGVGRMLGILNTSALRRRLSLDFSDVFEDGFAFDSITGDIAIGSGTARIRDLEILAAPADIRITGQANLVDGLLDQRVEVTPKLGTGFALAGAVAGGPAIGAAVLLADKVTDGALDGLGRYAYRVEGPWRDPVITRVETGGSVPSVGNLFVDDDTPAPAQPPDDSNIGSAVQAPRANAASRSSRDNNPFLEGF